MYQANIAAITILEERQRQEFEPNAMQELFQSIEKNGLMHAPVMREADNRLILVAGERRLKTLQDMWDLGVEVRYNGEIIPAGRVPYTTLGELSELDAEEAELDENMKRKDLTWQEQAAAVNRLIKLREKQYEKKVEEAVAVIAKAQGPEGPPVGRGHIDLEAFLTKEHITPPSTATITRELNPETAKGKSDGELGGLRDATRRQLIVAQHLSNPAIAKAKSTDEAFKILKKEEDATKNRALAASVGATFNASMHQALNVNCLDWMRQPANHSTIDVILTDPPYGMGADTFGDGGGKLAGIEHRYDDSFEAWLVLMQQWTDLSYKVAKPQAHAYVFCDIDNFGHLKDLMRAAGWYVFRTPLIIYKQNSGRVPLPDRGPRRQYEIVLYAIKGEMPVTHIYPDVIPSQADDNMSHGAQKPVMVYENLLLRSVRPGMRVADFFSGSGTIFPAAHSMKVSAIGIEMNPEYFGMGLRRLQDLEILDALGA